jgi:MoxR-like ATPase
MEHLLLERDGVELAAIPLGATGLEVGAAAGNGLRLRGPDVRPFHLALRRRRSTWWAVGRGGALQLEAGERVEEVPLEPGVRLAVGPYRLEVAQERRSETRTGPATTERTRPMREPAPHTARATPLLLRWPGRDGRLVHRRLEAGETTVGRDDGCDVVLADPSVSARHARIVVDERGAVLEDLASLNGCWLDGRRIWAADLPAGSVLRLGGAELQVLTGAETRGAGRAIVRPVFPPGLAPVLEVLRVATDSSEPCLLLGETGCGKEVLARRLHALGRRSAGPFVPLNVAALPRELAESLLLGHRRGAFTGATEAHRGAFERADGGTLFLDEVGETPPELQGKLLRALEEGSILPVGGERPLEVDVRVVAATNRDLALAVRAGRFRTDLWHRLAVFVVRVPPLRERADDIAPLAAAILDAVAREAGRRTLSDEALEVLREHDWPGNVRELRNALVRAAATNPDEVLGADAMRQAICAGDLAEPRGTLANPQELLDAHGGNISAAARAAGLARSTFRDLLEQGRRSDTAPPSARSAG